MSPFLGWDADEKPFKVIFDETKSIIDQSEQGSHDNSVSKHSLQKYL